MTADLKKAPMTDKKYELEISYLPLNPSKLPQQAIIYPIGRQTGKSPAILKVTLESVVNKKYTTVKNRIPLLKTHFHLLEINGG